jgi:hypothetical protein
MAKEIIMSDSSVPSSSKPQDLIEIENAVMDLNAYNAAVKAGTFPGAHAQAVAGLLKFLKDTFQQLEAQYRAHPYAQELMKKAEEEQLEKSRKAQEEQDAMQALGMVNG